MVIVGLGNPGAEYRWTRHNTGFLFVDFLAKKYRKRFRKLKDYEETMVKIENENIRLIKPLLFMNRSGEVLGNLVANGLIIPGFIEGKAKLIVVLDDINLPLGRMRLRAKGSDGGHRGLRSIIEALSTEFFPRLRIGIANQDLFKRQINATEFVLSPFKKEEKEIIKQVIYKAIDGIEMLVAQGFEKAQNFINSVNIFHEIGVTQS
ncbi:MAG: aminoacyl-tRNA hydrolase [candidate division WOR-3 bacterium]|nr:aminoacyl-tRNA hydrolase [candidate division WOR-3 bacterium]